MYRLKNTLFLFYSCTTWILTLIRTAEEGTLKTIESVETMFKHKRLVGIVAVALFYCSGLPTCRTDFDLNELAVDDDAPPPPINQKPAQPQRRPDGKQVSREQIRKLNAIRAKVMKLFEVLKICDVENFDVDKIEVPKTWSEQNKAIMALNKAAKSNLIGKSSLERYKRVARNCNLISKKFSASQDDSSNVESQVSGVDYLEWKRFEEQVENSPLDSLRERLTGTHEGSSYKSETIRENLGAATRTNRKPEKNQQQQQANIIGSLTVQQVNRQASLEDDGSPKMLSFL